MSTNLPNRAGQQQEKMDRLTEERDRLREENTRLLADGRLRLSAAEREALARHVGELLQTFGPDTLESEEGRRQIERDRKNLTSAVTKLRATSDKSAFRQPAPDVQGALADALGGLVNVLEWAAVNIEAGNLSAAEELGRRMSDARAALLLAGRLP